MTRDQSNNMFFYFKIFARDWEKDEKSFACNRNGLSVDNLNTLCELQSYAHATEIQPITNPTNLLPARKSANLSGFYVIVLSPSRWMPVFLLAFHNHHILFDAS